MSVTKYRANNQVFQFLTSAGGTVVISLPQTLTTIARDGDLLDVSSGNDNQREYIGGLDTLQMTIKWFDDTGAAGTVIEGVLGVPFSTGTLNYGPRGSASGSKKYSFAYIVKNPTQSLPFDKPVDWTAVIHRNGAMITDAAVGGTW